MERINRKQWGRRSYQIGFWERRFHWVSKLGPDRTGRMKVPCHLDECYSQLAGVTQRVKKQWKTYSSVQMTDGREKSHFSQIMGLFLLLVMHRRLKWSLYFTNGRTKWFKTFVIMTYFGVKNQFLLQQGSVNLGKGRGRVEDCELRGREGGSSGKKRQWGGRQMAFGSSAFIWQAIQRLFGTVEKG